MGENMAGVNQLLPFANGDTPNVISFDDWNALSARQSGFQSGIASSQQFNYILAQGGAAGYVIGQLVADYTTETATISATPLYQSFKQAMSSFVSSSPVTATGSTTPRPLDERFADSINVKDFGAKGDGVTDDTAAIQAAISSGKDVFIPAGIYLCNMELEITTEGQKIFGAGAGVGYDNGRKNPVIDYSDVSTLLFDDPVAGSAARRIRTRSKYRGSAEDPQDSPMSVCLNIQAESVCLEDFAVRLKTDVSESDREQILTIDPATATPEQKAFLIAQSKNLGADWDVGIFIGTRILTKLTRVNVVGYHRMSNVWLDSTNGHNLPRFPDLSGVPYPSGYVEGGSDGFDAKDCFFFGGLWGFRVQGAEPKDGETGYSDPYYDEILGESVTDRRGSFGCSDLLMIGCKITGPQHYSHLRRVDMNAVGNPVTDVYKGGAYSIGGLGSAYSRIHSHTYLDCRFTSTAPFNVRVDRSSSDLFVGCVMDNGGGAYDTNANAVVLSTATSFNGLVLTENSLKCRFVASVGNLYGTYSNIYAGNHTLLSCDSDGELDNVINAKTITLGSFDSGTKLNASISILSDPGQAASVKLGAFGGSTADLNWYNTSRQLALLDNNNEVFRFRFLDSDSSVEFSLNGESSCKIKATGEDATLLLGSNAFLRMDSVGLRSYKTIRPSSDNALNLGTGVARWANVYVASGAISTSDERAKYSIEDPEDAVIRAWEKVSYKVFQFKDAVDKKGKDVARIHVGVIAQQVVEAFESEGVDPFRIGIVCHDEWEDQFENVEVIDTPEVLDENGDVVVPAVKHIERRKVRDAGDRYGIRYEEAFALESICNRKRIAEMQSTIDKLVEKVGGV